jgi:hypothetical protein
VAEFPKLTIETGFFIWVTVKNDLGITLFIASATEQSLPKEVTVHLHLK